MLYLRWSTDSETGESVKYKEKEHQKKSQKEIGIKTPFLGGSLGMLQNTRMEMTKNKIFNTATPKGDKKQ